ncbi:MAG: hypothetical protein PHH84_03275 [Oscillospiraceae bacterium]|nr:hypothetical protein [Oscillospiraceae bacterium]MDD4592883.1 hypothetical protein [Parabacteroides sp.]
MDKSNNFVNGYGIPMGFGMALAKNSKAMDYFSSLTEDERKTVIDGVNGISSKQEMQDYINNLVNRGYQG